MGQSYAGFQGKKLIVKQRGAVAIETVFLLPIVIILLFAIVHYSMIFFATTLFDYAAKESIRSAMSQVDENCYFNVDGCSDSDTLTLVSPVILDSATQVIQGVTHGSVNSLGVLFGVTLPARNELISAAVKWLVPGAWLALRRVGDKAVVVFRVLKCESPRSKGVAG